jgi:hypothetical protein
MTKSRQALPFTQALDTVSLRSPIGCDWMGIKATGIGMGADQFDRIVDGFPTSRAAIKWSLLVAALSMGAGYGASYLLSSSKIAVLGDKATAPVFNFGALERQVSHAME